MSTRPSRNSPSRRRGMHRRRVTGVPGRAFARRNSSTNCPINHSQIRRGSSGERFGDAGGPGPGSSPPSGRLHSDGHLDRLDGAGPIQNGVGGASLTARTRLSTASPGRPPAAAARWFQWHAEARQSRSARRQPRRPASVRCRCCGHYGLVGDPAGPGSTDPSPQGSGGGVAPAQPLPAVKPASRHHRGPLRLAGCGACPPS